VAHAGTGAYRPRDLWPVRLCTAWAVRIRLTASRAIETVLS